MLGVAVRKISVILACLSACLTSGCLSTPRLSEATGTEQSNIFIKDVVQRVKCELSEAFDEKVSRPGFVWLSTWTAHVDLTLTINDNAGVAPNVTFTQFRRSAPNYSSGQTPVPLVPQSLAVAVGANLSGQAVRTEALSFTIALDELKMWRRHQDEIESEKDFPDDRRTCNFGRRIGVTGNLGLQEWVDSALYPAE